MRTGKGERFIEQMNRADYKQTCTNIVCTCVRKPRVTMNIINFICAAGIKEPQYALMLIAERERVKNLIKQKVSRASWSTSPSGYVLTVDI